MAVDSATGSVYVSGRVSGSIHGQTFAGGSFDIVLLKYDAWGARQWTRLAGSSGYDQGYGGMHMC